MDLLVDRLEGPHRDLVSRELRGVRLEPAGLEEGEVAVGSEHRDLGRTGRVLEKLSHRYADHPSRHRE